MLSEKPWKIEAVLGLCLAILGSMLLGAALSSLFKSLANAASGEQADFIPFVLSTVSFHGAILVLAGWFLRYHQVGWVEAFGFNSSQQVFAVCLAMGTAIVVLPVAEYLGKLSAIVMTWFRVEPVAQKAVTTLQSTVGIGRQLYFAFMAVALAPAAEELLFRGILYPALKRVWRAAPAALLTSVVFGAFHANLMTFIPLTVLALALTWLYEVTNNLLAPILAHSLFNMANFFWLVVDRPGGLVCPFV